MVSNSPLTNEKKGFLPHRPGYGYGLKYKVLYFYVTYTTF